MPTDNRTLLTTLKYTLLTRKFMTAFLAVTSGWLSHYAQMPDDVTQGILILGGIIIAGIAYEDGQAKGGTQSIQAGTIHKVESTTPSSPA